MNFHAEEILVSDLMGEALKTLDIILDIRNQNIHLSHDVTLSCDKKWTVEAMINF